MGLDTVWFKDKVSGGPMYSVDLQTEEQICLEEYCFEPSLILGGYSLIDSVFYEDIPVERIIQELKTLKSNPRSILEELSVRIKEIIKRNVGKFILNEHNIVQIYLTAIEKKFSKHKKES